MDTMTAYVRSLSDAELLDLASKNLVTSQSRTIATEVERRGLIVKEWN